ETIVACLMRAAEKAGVKLKVRSPIVSAEKTENGFALLLRSVLSVRCDRLLLATGSSPTGHRIATALGHTLEAPVPSLFTFNVSDKRLHQLSGVAVNPVVARLKLPGVSGKKNGKHKLQELDQMGPLLITHWGLSGPAVLKLSAWGARLLHEQKYTGEVWVNWLPALSQDEIRVQLQQMKREKGKKAISTYSPYEPISKRLWQYLLLRSEIVPELTWANLSKKQLNRLVQELSQGVYIITGKGVFKDEFVTCGGVKLKEVDFKTMESRRCEGLYLSGEILNIDGVTGGFNFQSAWTTGWLAGQAMSRLA
ncbi:MAG: aminoacetone oxidase family FAD-binding enzyme, partial [Cyanobacteria bacterium J06649_4]